MSNYVPHYTKKRAILKRKEDTLRRLINRGVSEQKLFRAAEEVRAARIRALQASLATLPPAAGPDATESARIAARIEALRVTPTETILAEFGIRQPGPTTDCGEAPK
jgi:hypothetical protein